MITMFFLICLIHKGSASPQQKEAFSEKHCPAAGKISPSIFDLEEKTKFFLVLYKIFSGSTRGNEKILFFIRILNKPFQNFSRHFLAQNVTFCSKFLQKIIFFNFLVYFPR